MIASQSYSRFVHDTNLMFHHIPKVLSSTEIWWPCIPFGNSELIALLKKKYFKISWALRHGALSWEQPSKDEYTGHEGMDTVSNNSVAVIIKW